MVKSSSDVSSQLRDLRIDVASLARAERYAKLSRTEKRFVARIIDVLLE